MRVKTGPYRRQRHNKVLNLVKGYRMGNHRRIKLAKEAMLHAGQYAYKGRKLRKRQFRSLWIVRINGALDLMGISYSKFMGAMKASNINLDRKVLADLVLNYPAIFEKIVNQVKVNIK